MQHSCCAPIVIRRACPCAWLAGMSTTPTRRPPGPGGDLFLTDGGLETVLVFHDGMDPPAFAAFPLLLQESGRRRLADYYRPYLSAALDVGAGFVLETPTWRANTDWGELLGYDADGLARINRLAVELLMELRDEWPGSRPVAVSGCIGPRGDGYVASDTLAAAAYADYHAPQIETFVATPADLVTAMTMTNVNEAVGIADAAERAGIPAVLSFTVETDGRLPSGTPLGDAIRATDAATDSYPAYYMVNCAHPVHLAGAFVGEQDWTSRVGGFRGNASLLSHAELDEATELDDGDPVDLAARSRALRRELPDLFVIGGCCGTDHRHIEQLARAFTG